MRDRYEENLLMVIKTAIDETFDLLFHLSLSSLEDR